jgi:hypothetical protein
LEPLSLAADYFWYFCKILSRKYLDKMVGYCYIRQLPALVKGVGKRSLKTEQRKTGERNDLGPATLVAS